MHMHAQAPTHTHAHARTHARTHAHARTHTHALPVTPTVPCLTRAHSMRMPTLMRNAYPRASLAAEPTPCAGAYVYGIATSNQCPPNSLPILEEATCRNAAGLAGKRWDSAENSTTTPRGCYLYTDGSLQNDRVFFNANAVGGGSSYGRPLCRAVTAVPTPAPTNVGDTNQPTLAPTTRAPTMAPTTPSPKSNWADESGRRFVCVAHMSPRG